MMTSDDHTDPGIEVPEKQPSRQVHLSLKEWSIIVGFAVIGTTVLFYMIRGEIRPVATALAHHIEVDDKRDAETDEEIKALKAEDKETMKAMHRIELKQEALAPPHRLRNLDDDLRAPPMPARREP